MINVNLLKSRMVYCNKNQSDLARELHLSQTAINQKINNVRKMTLDEAFEIKRILEISDSDFENYFFLQSGLQNATKLKGE